MPKKTKQDQDKTELLDALRGKLKKQKGGIEDDQLAPEMQTRFLEYISVYEEAEWTTSFDVLSQSGLTLPPSETLDDAQISVKLWEVIRALAMLRTFVFNTDHLSDRELYETLWNDILREEFPNMPVDNDSAWQIDLLGSGSEQDSLLYLRYYADEETRQRWTCDYPADTFPAHEDLPYDRDRHLPTSVQPEWFQQDRPS